MLFNSYVFLLVFLPVVVTGFYLIAGWSRRATSYWLLLASFVFFGWWSVRYLGLLIAMMLFTFFAARFVSRLRSAGSPHARTALAIGVVGNLAVLGYYKYSRFVVENVASLTGLHFSVEVVVLPLAISFYTFQQIAYLVDTWRDSTPRYSIVEYFAFISFFPQLIAGPIVHHDEVIPQLRSPRFGSFDHARFAEGVGFIVIGLLKKVLIADSLAPLVDPAFDAEPGTAVPFADAWLATTAYTSALYFDFSGYCDIAVGLGRLFGIYLPYNFNSPYKATSIVDFWRRWHITLSRFLRDYLYIPLGGNRHGPGRRYLHLMITMLLGGLWHGAGWTFVLWGALHGMYLAINHGWVRLHAGLLARGVTWSLPRHVSWAMTLLAVMIAWVFFRAPSFERAVDVLQGMAGMQGLISPQLAATLHGVFIEHGLLPGIGILPWWDRAAAFAILGLSLWIALRAPNTQELIDGADIRTISPLKPALLDRGLAAPLLASGFFLGLALMSELKEFVYFQF